MGWFCYQVHYKFELMDETLFLTINLIDRFLERQVVVRKKLQLVGVTAMLLACKYEEVSVPIVEDFVLISDKAYTREDVLGMEKSMVNKLQFNFSVPTPYVFMRRFLKAAQSDKKVSDRNPYLNFISCFWLLNLIMVLKYLVLLEFVTAWASVLLPHWAMLSGVRNAKVSTISASCCSDLHCSV